RSKEFVRCNESHEGCAYKAPSHHHGHAQAEIITGLFVGKPHLFVSIVDEESPCSSLGSHIEKLSNSSPDEMPVSEQASQTSFTICIRWHGVRIGCYCMGIIQ